MKLIAYAVFVAGICLAVYFMLALIVPEMSAGRLKSPVKQSFVLRALRQGLHVAGAVSERVHAARQKPARTLRTAGIVFLTGLFSMACVLGYERYLTVVKHKELARFKRAFPELEAPEKRPSLFFKIAVGFCLLVCALVMFAGIAIVLMPDAVRAVRKPAMHFTFDTR